MINIIQCTIVLLLNSIVCFAQEKNVLFIGNSHTSYNDMPQTVQMMINERKLKIKVEQITQDGSTLVGHIKFKDDPIKPGSSIRIAKDETTNTIKKLLGKNWDVVVLQEAAIAILIPQQRKYWTEPAVLYLDSVIKSISAKTILFQNYALQKHPQMYSFPYGLEEIFRELSFDPNQKVALPVGSVYSDKFQNSSQEFEVFKQEYDVLSKKIHAEVAEIGYFFEQCKKKYPKIQLYMNSEDNHPSKEGSYLIACIFFKCITKESLNNITFSADVDKVTAKKLRDLVEVGSS